jgi:exonuclease III
MAPSPALRILSHNVRGLVKRVDVIALVRAWWDTGAHIVCFQETWADCRGGLSSGALTLFLDDACKAVGLRGVPDLLLASNTLGPGHRAGVGILVLRRPDTELVLLKDDVHRTPDGRVVRCGVRWGGHRLSLVNTYWPTAAPRRGQLPSASRHACQRRFFTEVLLPAVQPCTAGSLVIMGDFNFVADAAIDRSTLPSGAASNPDRRAEEATAEQVFTALQTAGHPVVDAFRQVHRRARGYTHSGHNSSARLDRVLLSDALIPFLHRCWVGAGSGNHSDHLPLLCSLLPRVAPVSLLPQWRAPTAVLEPADLVERLTVWIKRTVEVHLPLADAELVAHWPTIKAGFRQEICFLARTLRARRQYSPSEQAAKDDLESALAALLETGSAEARAELLVQQANFAAATQSTSIASAHQARAAWLHTRETPSPLLSRLLKPTAQHSLAVLRSPDGSITSEPGAMAHILTSHFAAVSTAAATSPAAQAAVLQAIAAEQQTGGSKRVPALHSGAAGIPSVTVGAVLMALDSMQSGRAPGPDGIPLEFWRVGRGAWAPLLARLFSAMAACHTLPADFTLGRVVPLPKGGLTSCPGNYRPITLLNADYKILARILATRFGYALQLCVGPHQTAFLQGREIGDSIFAAELLGSALAAEQLPGAAVILDIAKAYDTVDRSFLFRIMAAAGCGRPMVRHPRVHRRSRSCVQGPDLAGWCPSGLPLVSAPLPLCGGGTSLLA